MLVITEWQRLAKASGMYLEGEAAGILGAAPRDPLVEDPESLSRCGAVKPPRNYREEGDTAVLWQQPSSASHG